MALRIGTSLPHFDGATHWLNRQQTANDDTPNGPTLVYFWAMSCPACKLTMPALQVLRDKYAPLGLQVISIHSPRGPFDMDADAVTKMAGELGITEPCALDDMGALAEAFETGGAWPIHFVFGANQKLKVRAAGGFGVKMCESALRNVFGQNAA